MTRLIVYLLFVVMAVGLAAGNLLIPALVAAGIAATIALRREFVLIGTLGILSAEYVAARWRRYTVTIVASPRTRSSR